MRRIAVFLLPALYYFSFGLMPTTAQDSVQKCPVVIDQVALGYNHAGGHSAPQLMVRFGNEGSKPISTVTFSLSLLGPGGDPRPYPDDLRYSDKLNTGKTKMYTWPLNFESVDIHNAGETVFVQRVEFEDSTAWTDDGSESCVFTVDFHAR